MKSNKENRHQISALSYRDKCFTCIMEVESRSLQFDGSVRSGNSVISNLEENLESGRKQLGWNYRMIQQSRADERDARLRKAPK